MCVRTVMDTTDPDIWFDENGVSSHALRYDREIAHLVNAARAGEREEELAAIVAEIKAAGEGKPYDCIIGISGGVDSTYLAYTAVKMGLRPLAVHFDSGWNSELAVNNIENLVKKLGIDLYTDVVDWREMKDLQLSFFKAGVPNCDIPTDHAFGAVAFRQAAKYGIKYVLSGSNLVSESILPVAWGYDSADSRHLKAIQRRFGTVKLKNYPVFGYYKRFLWYEIIKGVTTIAPLNYIPYSYKEAKETITRELGWRDYGGKHYESVFTRYFQGYYLPHKFGYDKRKAHWSSLILSGNMTRKEAHKGLETPTYDEALRKQDHEFIAKKLGVSTEELERIFDQPPVPHEAYPMETWMWRATLGAERLAAKLSKPPRRLIARVTGRSSK
jgi:N-acetyl sugar amidotransferase